MWVSFGFLDVVLNGMFSVLQGLGFRVLVIRVFRRFGGSVHDSALLRPHRKRHELLRCLGCVGLGFGREGFVCIGQGQRS